MTQEDYIFTQWQLWHSSALKFINNGNKFKNEKHRKEHNRIMRRLRLAHGEKA